MDFNKILDDLQELRKKYVEDEKGRNKIESEVFEIVKSIIKDEDIFGDCDKMFQVIDKIVDDNNKGFLLGKYHKFLMDNYGKSEWKNYLISKVDEDVFYLIQKGVS